MSRPTRLLVPAAVTLALALAAPAAPAMPIVDAPAHSSGPIATRQLASSDATSLTAGTRFDWGSAAVGGGGVLILVALVSAGLAVSGRARVTTTR